MSSRLQGKKAIVTGASRNIGRAIAVTFAQAGADVVLTYNSDQEGARATLAMIEECGAAGQMIQVDLAKPDQVQAMFEQATQFHGHIDLLVNNAGGYDTSHFLQLSPKILSDVVNVGPIAAAQLSQLVVNQMVNNVIAGSIINVSSISGVRPYPNRAAHSTAKAALNMLTQSMALDLAIHGIRVNAIAPGNTPEDPAAPAEGIPLGRVGTAQDQANAALFLASDDASWITGQILVVDGGQALSFS